MRISREHLLGEAVATGFRPEVLEKAVRLLNLLEGFRSHPFLKDRLALKGGTALNLFIFELPRLSVDLDMNYIGAADREGMLAERPKVEEAVNAVCRREGFTPRYVPDDHAGGKWRLHYESALGPGGNLELDLNFMFRLRRVFDPDGVMNPGKLLPSHPACGEGFRPARPALPSGAWV